MKRFQIKTHLLAFGFLLNLIVLAGCQGNEEFSGEFAVEMTDSKGDYARVDVEISKVEILHDSEGWIDLESNAKVYTVTDLTNGKSTGIAARNNLALGHYSKVRLSFGANSKIQAGLFGLLTAFDATAKSSIEINIDYELEAGEKQTALIDFHVGSSVQETVAGFTLSPVVTWVKNKNTGIQGTFQGNTRGWVKFTSETGATFDAYTDDQGQFFVQGMTSGNYTAECFPKSGEGFAEVYTYNDIRVNNGEIASMGTLHFR